MFQDFAYALRTLRKTPGFTAVAVLSIALGIGANSAIFSLADGLLLRPLPVPNASGIIAIQSQLKGESLAGVFQYSEVSYPDFVDLRKRATSFQGLAGSRFWAFGFATEKTGLPQMKFGVLVSGGFFNVLELRPALGRAFGPDEDSVRGRDAVVMLGHDLWTTEFGASPDVIGRTIYLNGIAFTVIGVAPAGFTGPHRLIRCALYVPLAMGPRLAADGQPDFLENRADRQMFIHGRLKPGVTVAQAAAEARVVSRQLSQAYPDTNRTCTLVASTDLKSRLQQDPLDLVLLVFLLALAGVVLLIACANVMNLMLSRGRARRREIAVRLAIGAGRARLIRQLLTESLVIAIAGGGRGLLVARAAADLFSQIRIPMDIPIVLDFRLDPRVLMFTVIASIASAVLFGLIPALQSTRPELAPALKSGNSDGARRGHFLGRNALVIAQVAGSLVLLVFATQAYRGASILLGSPAGFRTDHLLTAGLDPSLARYTPDQTRDFYKRLLERARNLPQVKAAALTEAIPMVPGGDAVRMVPEGVPLAPGTEAVSAMSSTVSEDYFDVIGTPILEGRPFSVTDRADSPRVAIVNEQFARKYYPNQSAVGKRLRMETANGPVVQIVGVARKSKYFFLIEPPVDYVYLPLSQRPRMGMSLLLHTAVPPGDLAAPLRELVRSLDSGQPVVGIRTMDEIFEQRARKTLDILIETIGAMGLLGLILALVGLYGLMTYSVGMRQREIGIRMAIGAGRDSVVQMVLKQGLTLAATGVAIGLALWLAASRPILAFLEARSFSWILLAVVAVGLLGAAALGAYIPARRASLVDPNTVLRQE